MKGDFKICISVPLIFNQDNEFAIQARIGYFALIETKNALALPNIYDRNFL